MHWFYRDLYEGDSGADVGVVAVKLGSADHSMTAELTARVRGAQRHQGLPVTGIVDRATAEALGESAAYGLVPRWFQDSLIDETGLRLALHISSYADLQDAIRRFQSAHHRYPTGDMDESLAVEIGE